MEGKNVVTNRANAGTGTEQTLLDRAPQQDFSLTENIIIYGSYALAVITFPISVFYCIEVVTEYERAVILRLGKLRKGRARGPGIFFVLPCTDSFFMVDLRIETFLIQPQEILTKDSCTVMVDAVVYFKIVHPLAAVINVDDYRKATVLMAATILRNVLGQENIIDILSERAKLAINMKGILEKATKRWGMSIERVEMRDVRLPLDMQRAMAAEAEATREARAKIVVAEGEMKAAEAMKVASNVIGDSEAALQLRYLQTLTSIKDESTRTIVFPMPIGWLK